MAYRFQQINFLDGSNPYICKDKREFDKMVDKYVLDKCGENSWIALAEIGYLMSAYKHKAKRPYFVKRYGTYDAALTAGISRTKENPAMVTVSRLEYRYTNKDTIESENNLISNRVVKVLM